MRSVDRVDSAPVPFSVPVMDSAAMVSPLVLVESRVARTFRLGFCFGKTAVGG